ncbi:penicillin-binding transpeptidase domain-containing protein [Fructilactobacillus florum]|uniref:PASTA domain-containing protein n=1 Tax=Fructilactobacillus florum DSM 22689 = JCM 16035 TaxID=1423745 RepID=A0A0R2CTP3_9LACO|nr:penicillin-binding transpeptidase domain-containing protein [Fructilactobacillus florum]KRM91643.1 hypothetical protein FC87_GL000779 [Fructilactobacillus florum DSM 22689 = JCM 16035]
MNERQKIQQSDKAAKSRRNFGRILLLFVVIVFGLIIVSFAQKAIFKTANHVNLSRQTQHLYNKTSIIKARRGSIYDDKQQPLAEDTNTYSMYAVLDRSQVTDRKRPAYVQDKRKTAQVLSQNLPISEQRAYQVLTEHPRAFQVEFGNAGNNIPLAVKQKIESHRLPGLMFIPQQARLYPNGVFASHVVGLASSTTDPKTKQPMLVGQMGIEKTFNAELTGRNGLKKSQHDNYGYQIPSEKGTELQARNGDNVHTNINSSLELLLENQMNKVDAEVHPKVLNAMLMDAKTGKIVAAAQRPSFNPTTGTGLDNVWRDTLTQDLYEPGSTMKIFTMAASIDSGNYRGSDLYQSGIYKIGNQIVPDWNRNGWGDISYDKGFALSSNVAMAHLEENMGPKTWNNYIQRFQLLKNNASNFDQQPTGSMQFQQPIEQANTAFGQGISVTALQMLQGFSAIANDGEMLKPQMINRVTTADNQHTVKNYGKTVVGHPISAKTAAAVRKHMEDVVYKPYGIGQDFQIPGYRVAAKTGTAQISDGSGQYENGADSYLYSVAGMAPAKHPRYVMYVTMKQPQLATQPATKVLAEIFNPVMQQALSVSKGRPEQVRIPNLVGKSPMDAQQLLNQKQMASVVIGTGHAITKQSPAAAAPKDLASRIILMTDGPMTMPDLNGWSRDDLNDLARLVNIKINFTGDGHVSDQSIKPGQQFDEKSTLDVSLK